MEMDKTLLAQCKRVQLIRFEPGDSMSVENNDPNLVRVTLGREDASEVTEHLLKHFFAFEPLTKHVKVDLETEIEPWLHGLISEQLSQGVSVGLRDKANQDLLVGVSVNEHVVRGQESLTLDDCVSEKEHPRMRQIIELICELYDDMNILDQLDTDQAVHICMISVRQGYGGQGIAKRLIELSEALSKEKKITTLFAEATGNYSAAAFVKKGFSVKRELAYKNCEVNGIKVFSDLPVHTALRLVVKSLSIDE